MGNGSKQTNESLKIPPKKQIRQWLQNGLDSEAIAFADKFGGKLKQGATMSQLRKIFGTLKELELRSLSQGKDGGLKVQLVMLKPRVAYTVARHQKLKELGLHTVIQHAVEIVLEDGKESQKRLRNFVRLFEAILAYFKYHGGK